MTVKENYKPPLYTPQIKTPTQQNNKQKFVARVSNIKHFKKPHQFINCVIPTYACYTL